MSGLAALLPPARRRATPSERLLAELRVARTDLRRGRFERSMALMTAFAAVVSGWEAYVQHQRGHWDDATRRVVLDRVHNVPPFRHFGSKARGTLAALCARVIPQAHRPAARRVPIAPWIDQHCTRGTVEGFRFDDMPPNDVAWDWGLAGLDQTATALFGAAFAALDAAGQDQVLRVIRRGDPPGEVWQRMPARRWWIYVALRQITGVYYAHPFAWDEIGFGGPAYPRGYFALNHGAPEPWEPREAGEGTPR